MSEDPTARPGEPLVDAAEQALRDLGGNLIPGFASTLLRHWRRTQLLTLDEFSEVIRRSGPMSR